MKTIVIIEDRFFIPLLEPYIVKHHSSTIVAADRTCAGELKQIKKSETIILQHFSQKACYRKMGLTGEDRVICCFRNSKKLQHCLQALRSLNVDVPIVVVDIFQKHSRKSSLYYNIYFVPLENVIEDRLGTIWKKNENRRKLKHLDAINQQADKILILLQNDPDPDALGSGLALRALLGRNRQTAPLGSFGEVTRSENLNMIKSLDIQLLKLTAASLKRYDTIAMVDVQPPYFNSFKVQADIVIDHHPCHEHYDAVFTDIRVPYGATSTILGEYLIDTDCKITQRLATALVYGIKTDTMFLDRDISPADIEVFTQLYPLVNLNRLRHIEHASLEYTEIHEFVKALKNAKLINNILFTYLGRVTREDIIPRLADFCLQISGTEWSFVSGMYNGNIICCVRNVGYIRHAGELVSNVFGSIGSAGGHRSMARAVMPAKKFKQHYNISLRGECENKLMDMFLNALEQ